MNFKRPGTGLLIIIFSCIAAFSVLSCAGTPSEYPEYVEQIDSSTPEITLPPVRAAVPVPETQELPIPEFSFTPLPSPSVIDERPVEIPAPVTPLPPLSELPVPEPQPEPIPPEPMIPEPPISEPPLIDFPPPYPLLLETLDTPMADTAPEEPEEPIADIPIEEPEPEIMPPAPQPAAPPPAPPLSVPELPPVPPVQPLPPAPQPDPLPQLPARPIPDPLGEDIVFSRSVRATVGQIVEIPFRGTGWVFLGELANRRGIRYESRRLDVRDGETEGQSFIFLCESPGTYILRFYRQDFIQDYIINDHVQVIVGESSTLIQPPMPGMERSRVIAEPRWPTLPMALSEPIPPSVTPYDPMPAPAMPAPAMSPPAIPVPSADLPVIPQEQVAPPETVLPDAPELSGNDLVGISPDVTTEDFAPFPEPEALPSASPQTLPSPTLPTIPVPPPDELPVTPPLALLQPPAPESIPYDEPTLSLTEYVQRARQEFDAGRVEQALQILDIMRIHYPMGSDEAWWLYAQLLEANSPSRDIRLSLEYYRKLINEYPLSSRVPEAQRRVSYLERFFFNIR